MGDYRQSLLNPYHTSKAEDSSGRGQEDDPLGLQSPVYEGLRSTDLKYQDLDDGKLGFEDQEEETPPEEVTEEELTDAQEPGEAFLAVERDLEKDEEEGVTEMRWVWGVGLRHWGESHIPTSTLCPCGLCVIAVSVGPPHPLGPCSHSRVTVSGRAGNTPTGL